MLLYNHVYIHTTTFNYVILLIVAPYKAFPCIIYIYIYGTTMGYCDFLASSACFAKSKYDFKANKQPTQ